MSGRKKEGPVELRVEHDEERGRFVVSLEAGEAYVAYSPAGGGKLDYRSTFVPPAHREEGIGTALVKEALDYARENGFRVIPTCPFVTDVVERNPEYRDSIAE